MTRFHTLTGKFVGWKKVPGVFPCFIQTVRRKLTGKLPRKPWIPYSATAHLERILKKDWNVRETGAGMSTLWLAPRVGRLVSIEHQKPWYERMARQLKDEGLTNVDIRFASNDLEVANFSDVPDASLDLLTVDGAERSLAVINGFAKVKPGGYLYLDNWDFEHFWPEAIAFLDQHASEIQSVTSFIDYVPAQVAVTEGRLIEKKR